MEGVEAGRHETWEVDLPDGLDANEIRYAAWEALFQGNANLLEDEHDDEHDREIVSVAVVEGSVRM